MLTHEESEKLIRTIIAIDEVPLLSVNERGDGSLFKTEVTTEHREKGLDIPDYPAVSMIGLYRMRNLRDCIVNCLEEKILGNVILCGTWRGGDGILASKLLEGTGRKVYVCDSFDGVPPPDPAYHQDTGQSLHTSKHLKVPLKEVKENYKRFDALGRHVVFVEGVWQETLKGIKGPFCVVRVDGDLYGSTYVALDRLYPQLSPGGYLIEDDWILGTAQEAVKDYRRTHNVVEPILAIDGIGVYWRKGVKTDTGADTI